MSMTENDVLTHGARDLHIVHQRSVQLGECGASEGHDEAGHEGGLFEGGASLQRIATVHADGQRIIIVDDWHRRQREPATAGTHMSGRWEKAVCVGRRTVSDVESQSVRAPVGEGRVCQEKDA
jgi:hypothetical protein